MQSIQVATSKVENLARFELSSEVCPSLVTERTIFHISKQYKQLPPCQLYFLIFLQLGFNEADTIKPSSVLIY